MEAASPDIGFAASQFLNPSHDSMSRGAPRFPGLWRIAPGHPGSKAK